MGGALAIGPVPEGWFPGRGDFEIRVRGRVGEAFRSAFVELTVVLRPAETVLVGAGLDQRALYAILDRIRALGLELLDLRQLPDAGV
ncbi:hypothetical protein [Streptomyces kanamyceticus]|uniref:Uncharacterized protein n=1 Tax=Streptomyces kanamyceticus TaxID=1967 RepID=A0A5J6GFQ9_STRKN|nr:hypothetical protein [Streptomyces kanamyceticus]QEU93302.1 hypothetical protein CP970_22360 [Streptomyces kanamyceticus]